jgi:hypothetical protein
MADRRRPLRSSAAPLLLRHRWAPPYDPLAILSPFRNPPRLLATQSPSGLMRLEFWYVDLLFVHELNRTELEEDVSFAIRSLCFF